MADIHLKSLIIDNPPKKSEIFNCGYGKGYSIKEVINCLNNLIEDYSLVFNIEFEERAIADVSYQIQKNLLK